MTKTNVATPAQGSDITADELQARIRAYGVDEKGNEDRFMGNIELYKQCFLEFCEEPNLVLLEAAMREKDYAQAFAPAHALKGLSGNLGLTAFYDAICVLVESLRANSYGSIGAEYAQVEREHRRLGSLLPSAAPAQNAESAPAGDTW